MTWTHGFESINAYQCGFLGLLEIGRNWRWLEDDMKMTQQDGLSNRHVVATSYLIHPVITLYYISNLKSVVFLFRCQFWNRRDVLFGGVNPEL